MEREALAQMYVSGDLFKNRNADSEHGNPHNCAVRSSKSSKEVARKEPTITNVGCCVDSRFRKSMKVSCLHGVQKGKQGFSGPKSCSNSLNIIRDF